MNKIGVFLIAAFAFLLLSGQATAMEFRTSFDLDYQSLSLKDPADTIYIGEFNKGGSMGINGHADWLFEVMPGLLVGPNFDFSYATIASTWYSVLVFQPSIGPVVEWKVGDGSVSTFINYSFGWVNTEQLASSSANPAPAGSFAANYYGLIFGLRSRIPVTEQFVIGPYITYGLPALLAFKYKSLQNGSYVDRWINLDTSFLRFGLSIYVDQFWPK